VKVGRCIYTTTADLESFFEAVTQADQDSYAEKHPTKTTESSLSNTQRDKQHATAERELKVAGI